MSLYTSTIMKKNQLDQQLEREADNALKKNMVILDYQGKFEDVQEVLRYILDKFHITMEPVGQWDSVSEMMDYILDPLCIMYENIDLEDGWTKKTVYMLGFLENGKAVALIPAIVGYNYYDPTTRKIKRVTHDLKLKKKAYILYHPIGEEKYSLYNFAKLIFNLVSYRDYIPIIVATALISLLGLATPAINRWVLNDLIFIGNQAYPGLMMAAFLLISAGVFRTIVSAIKNLLLSSVKLRVTAQVQAAVMAKILFLPSSFFKNSAAGKIAKRINNSRVLAEKILDLIMNTSITVLFSLIYIPQMAKLAPTLCIPALIILGIQIIVSTVASSVYAQNMLASNEVSMEANSFTFASMKGIQKLKNTGAEKRIYAQWARLYGKTLGYDLDPPKLVKLKGILLSYISTFGTILLIALAIPAGISRGDYIAFVASYGLISASVSELTDVIHSFFMIKPLVENIRPIFETLSEQTHSLEYVKKLDGNIEIENVSFRYENGKSECLKNISLSIKRGTKVAIVGESGCGKSTLIKLLMGLETPESGMIYYDGKSLNTLNLRSLRRRIGSVFQFSRVMPGSIYSNIVFNTTEITEKEVWEAARQASIDELIESLPLGIETEISESNAGGFSGGQKQCILLARAFARKSPVLMLDEATSALDNETQKKVLDAIFQMKTTVIMVAHRLSTVKDCDCIVMLENGTIKEKGTYDELMKKNGSFAQLVQKQIKN